MPFSLIRCAKLARIIGVLVLGAALAACSAVKLAYNNLPEVSYWWLDGYVDFDGTQTPRVRDELDQLLAWHRQNELPKILGLLRKAQTLAPGDVTAAQTCDMVNEIRTRLLALAERAEQAGAEVAVSLTESQLQQLERKYTRINADYRKDWLERSVEKQHEKRYEKFVERSEDFYGRLDAEQRDLLRQQVARSVFDPQELDAERKRRQREALTLLRRFNAQKTPPAEAQAAIHAYVLRIADPPPGPWRDRQQALQQEACHDIAEFHNQTSAAQRDKAMRRLQSYENDVRDLAASQ
ncbi:DUF6279 family lipoprotein [Variovorax sp. J2P1-59]|uniref:DUF6279 family lipoprotein n=1 Tax=Variovorax flavidus TaxID=3053501 RepID=UPI002574E500|nr:DUF6279 family lipoprotein [Variovorax sp. J2P1-59]MDM0076038.1 DUF6279 family lipoprotein [Variovorax sp. J2P1-59]